MLITEIVELIRQDATALQIGTAIQQYLNEKYANDPYRKPSVQNWTNQHYNQIIQWLINDYAWKILEANLMRLSSDPSLQSQGNDRLLNYATRYEDLITKLQTIINYPTTSSTTTSSTTTTSTTFTTTTTTV